uniref:VP1 n=1 Tax=Turdus naumanni parvoviridae sp. TaxID=2794525 RepID=A0A8E7G2F6_9VIRU|nr:MAG: VP1 [Turdus naumanni parvoviridae sp.]
MASDAARRRQLAIDQSIRNRERFYGYTRTFARGIESEHYKPVSIQGAHKQSEHIEQDRQGFALPGTKYTGPGNSLNRGPGVNQADEDAKKHDKEYHTAKSHKDIQKSDISLLQRAGDHFIEGISGKGTLGDTILSAAQGIGIGGKYLAEKAVGPIYPSKFAGKKCHHLVHINGLAQKAMNMPMMHGIQVR